MSLQAAAWYLKNQGVALEGGSLVFPSWTTYQVYLSYKDALALKYSVQGVLSSGERIKFREDLPKCPQCSHYRQFFCEFGKHGVAVPAGIMVKGCERFKQSRSIYF